MNMYINVLKLKVLIGTQPAQGERRKEKNHLLRDSNPGCLTVVTITTVP